MQNKPGDRDIEYREYYQGLRLCCGVRESIRMTARHFDTTFKDVALSLGFGEESMCMED